MDDTTLANLRPRDDSAGAIEDALGRITAALAGADGRLAQARNERTLMLLAGTAADLRDAAARIADAELDIEQLTALDSHLQIQVVEARRAGLIAELLVERAIVERRIREADDFCLEQYGSHAAAIVAGAKMVADARRSQRDYQQKLAAIGDPSLLTDDHPRFKHVCHGTMHQTTLDDVVRLPDVGTEDNPPGAPLWQHPQFHLYGHRN